MNPEAIPEMNGDIVWRLTDDGSVLVSPQSGDIRVLNNVGTTIWRLIDGERTIAQIAASLQEQYDAPLSQLEDDLHAFLEELSQRDLLSWRRAESEAA